MKKEVIITAKTIEEAVELAAKELGAPDANKIEYTVIAEPKKGLFGTFYYNYLLAAGLAMAGIYIINRAKK